MPILRQISTTGVPFSTCRSANALRSGMYVDLFVAWAPHQVQYFHKTNIPGGPGIGVKTKHVMISTTFHDLPLRNAHSSRVLEAAGAADENFPM